MKGASGRKVNKSFDFVDEMFPKNDKKGTTWLDPMLYNVGIYLMTPILLGVFIGYWLDNRFDASPWFVIIFLILGTISSFYNFFKIFRK